MCIFAYIYRYLHAHRYNLRAMCEIGVARNKPKIHWGITHFWAPKRDPLQKVPIAPQNRLFCVVDGGRNGGPK